ELPDPRGAPAALAPDLVAVVDPVRGELLARSGVGRGDVPGGVDTDGAALPAELRGRLVEEVDVGREALRGPADDREHQRQSVAGGADHRVRAPADGDPGGQLP